MKSSKWHILRILMVVTVAATLSFGSPVQACHCDDIMHKRTDDTTDCPDITRGPPV